MLALAEQRSNGWLLRQVWCQDDAVSASGTSELTRADYIVLTMLPQCARSTRCTTDNEWQAPSEH